MGRRIASTSRKAFRELTASGQIEQEKKYLLRVLSLLSAPITSRHLSTIAGIERTSVCRFLTGATDEGLVNIAHKGICPVTKKLVGFYQVVAKADQE